MLLCISAQTVVDNLLVCPALSASIYISTPVPSLLFLTKATDLRHLLLVTNHLFENFFLRFHPRPYLVREPVCSMSHIGPFCSLCSHRLPTACASPAGLFSAYLSRLGGWCGSAAGGVRRYVVLFCHQVLFLLIVTSALLFSAFFVLCLMHEV